MVCSKSNSIIEYILLIYLAQSRLQTTNRQASGTWNPTRLSRNDTTSSSNSHSVEIYKLMIQVYPYCLLIRDCWGDLPLTCALLLKYLWKSFTFYSRRTGKCGGYALWFWPYDRKTSEVLRHDVIWDQRAHFHPSSIWGLWSFIGVFRVLVEAIIMIQVHEQEHRAILPLKSSKKKNRMVQYVWGQYAMRNLRANCKLFLTPSR